MAVFCAADADAPPDSLVPAESCRPGKKLPDPTRESAGPPFTVEL